ncbi:hypothetical protein [Paenibacillus sp. N3.4]|uniref:hypothetical protein n=1 Tax=Paenibacillus sp. N3.4 TaxID=2603222 RepID=UPI0011CAEA57|nr:hypothetical protein [Paenibacillus sp. N3.4]TXK74486.1 hypothetical protein FU659_29410 [Paenibacillus sp. N3.4]
MKTQFKRRASQVSLLAFMVTMAFGAVGASAADSNTEAKTTITAAASTPAMTASSSFRIFSSPSNLLVQPAHQNNYLKLLASTYAPETLTAWKQALEERKQLESEMPKMTALRSVTVQAKDGLVKQDDTIVPNAVSKDIVSVPAIPAVELSEGTLSSGKQLVIQRLTKDGESAPDIVQALPFEGVVSDGIMNAEATESLKRQQKLAEAVEADDAATIKSLLPELLKDYKSETDSIRTMAKKLKDLAEKTKAEPTEESKK